RAHDGALGQAHGLAEPVDAVGEQLGGKQDQDKGGAELNPVHGTRSAGAPSTVVSRTTIGGVDARGFLDRLVAEEGAEASMAHVQVLEAREPRSLPLPDMPEVLRRRLAG